MRIGGCMGSMKRGRLHVVRIFHVLILFLFLRDWILFANYACQGNQLGENKPLATYLDDRNQENSRESPADSMHE